MARKSRKAQSWVASNWPVFAALVLVAALIAAFLYHARPPSAQPAPQAAGFWGKHYPSQGHQGHMPGDDQRYAHFRYSSDPPTSGYHREVFAPAFINTQALPKFVQVHMLEHGNILLQYNCLCPATVDQLTTIADEYNAKLLPPGTIVPAPADIQAAEESGQAVLVAPYPAMKYTIALTAWTRLATLPSVDREKIESFINHWLHNTDNINQ